MSLDKIADAKRPDRLIEEAMAELGLSYHERAAFADEEEAEEKSPSEIAVERFRQEYGKHVRASADR